MQKIGYVSDASPWMQSTLKRCVPRKRHNEEKHLAWKSRLRLLQKTYCLCTVKITQKKLNSQREQFKWQVGWKDRTRIKNNLKTSFQKGGDPFWTPSRKDWNNPPQLFPRKYEHNQIKQRGNTAALENEFENVLCGKNKSKKKKKSLLW